MTAPRVVPGEAVTGALVLAALVAFVVTGLWHRVQQWQCAGLLAIGAAIPIVARAIFRRGVLSPFPARWIVALASAALLLMATALVLVGYLVLPGTYSIPVLGVAAAVQVVLVPLTIAAVAIAQWPGRAG